jgi:hypothetical protein
VAAALSAIEDLQSALDGRILPGGSLHIARYESAIADHALRSPDRGDDIAHPSWLVIASLRGMGISITELCDLAVMGPADTLLFGEVAVAHDRPLQVGRTYWTTARIDRIERHQTRHGSVLDSLGVTVRVEDRNQHRHGTVTSTYLFMRGDQ